MKRYIHKLQEKSVYDKSEDEWFVGFDKNSVEEMLSDIEDEVSQIENDLSRGRVGICLQKLEELKERL